MLSVVHAGADHDGLTGLAQLPSVPASESLNVRTFWLPSMSASVSTVTSALSLLIVTVTSLQRHRLRFQSRTV